MNIVISLFLFGVINYWGLKYILSSRQHTLKAIGDSESSWTFSSGEMFVLLTLLCAPISAAPLGLLPIRLLLWILLTVIGIFVSRRPMILSPVTYLYLFYLLFLLFSLLYTSTPDYGFRVFLKYLLPFLLLLYIPSIVISRHIFAKGIQYIVLIFSIAIGILILSGIGINLLPLLGLQYVLWWGPAIVDSLSVFCPVVIVCAIFFKEKRYLWLLFPMVLLPIIFSIRTGIIAILITLLAMSVFRYRLKSVPFLLLLLLLGLGSIVFVPQIRNKMFYQEMTASYLLENYQHLSKNDIDSNGRFAMWEWLLRDYYEPNKLFGSGLGIQQNIMYQRMHDGFGAGLAHNDYIQILCDTGLLGLSLYTLIIILMTIHCFLIYNNLKLSLECRYSALIAGTSICGLAAAMMTDNVVNYTMVTLIYPFAFYAIAIGLNKKDSNVQYNHSIVQ